MNGKKFFNDLGYFIKNNSTMLLFFCFIILMFFVLFEKDKKTAEDLSLMDKKFEKYIIEKEEEKNELNEKIKIINEDFIIVKEELKNLDNFVSIINDTNIKQDKDISNMKGKQDLLTDFYNKMGSRYIDIQNSLLDIQFKISKLNTPSIEELDNINESINCLNNIMLDIDQSKADKIDFEKLNERVSKIENIDIDSIILSIKNLEDFKIYISDYENVNNFVQDLDCIKEGFDIILKMQQQINKLQVDLENQNNLGQAPPMIHNIGEVEKIEDFEQNKDNVLSENIFLK